MKTCKKKSGPTRNKQVLTSIHASYSSVFLSLPSLPLSICLLILWKRKEEGNVIGGRLTHLLADALLILGSYQGEK